MNILILTDYSRHDPENSVYSIARALQQQPEVSQVWSASRHDERNHLFFYEQTGSSLFGTVVDKRFTFEHIKMNTEKTMLISLESVDFIFLRLPRPVLLSFFVDLATHFPEKKIINRPSGIIKTSNKAFIRRFKKWIPPTQLVNSWRAIEELTHRHAIVLKPLENYGGRGIIKIENGKVSVEDKIQYSLEDFKKVYKQSRQAYLAMKFLKNVHLGDKRLVVAGRDIISVSLRFPRPGGWLCNVAQGGTAVPSYADDRELQMVEEVSTTLIKEGIFLFGLDTLVDDEGNRVLSEINTLSVGGIFPAEKQTGQPVSDLLAQKLVKYCNELI
ncbi:MAG TPA: glutathione synthetase [Saprospiraceae bacterium]|nr:glutathione synthetase [Saprospiraceae bacterium]